MPSAMTTLQATIMGFGLVRAAKLFSKGVFKVINCSSESPLLLTILSNYSKLQPEPRTMIFIGFSLAAAALACIFLALYLVNAPSRYIIRCYLGQD